MNYFTSSEKSRKGKYDSLIDVIDCDNHHNQVLYFSHDEAKSYLKKLTQQLPEDTTEYKYANLKAFFTLLYCQPGKKLNFMGLECVKEDFFENYMEEGASGMVDSVDLNEENRRILANTIKELNRIYTSIKAFNEYDANGNDLEWVLDPNKIVHAYRRMSSDGETYLCAHNFTSHDVKEFKVTLDIKDHGTLALQEIFSSDDPAFGGKNRKNTAISFEKHGDKITYSIKIPPLTTVIIQEKGKNTDLKNKLIPPRRAFTEE